MPYRQICLVLLLVACLPVVSSVHAGSKTPLFQKKYYKSSIFNKKCPQASCPDISQVCKLAAVTVGQSICLEAYNEAYNQDKPKIFETIKSEIISKFWPPICGPLSTYEDSEGVIVDKISGGFTDLKWCKDYMTTIIEEKEKKGKETEKTESGQSFSGCPVCPEPSKDDCGENPLGK